MSGWEVRLTQTAVEDIREAAWYMRAQLGAPGAATAFLDKVDEQVQLLSEAPKSRPLVRDFELARAGYHWCAVGGFLMFYTLDEKAAVVNVERVLYGGRDWKALL